MFQRRAPLFCALLILSLGKAGCGCNGGHRYVRPDPLPEAKELLNRVGELSTRAMSFRAESVMDYWVGKERVRGTVLVMGKRGARMRFNALNPTGGNVAADLACNGVDYKYVDYNNNCQLTGPCTKTSIAQLLRVVLEPDDFLLLAVGGTPILTNADGTVRWDSKKGQAIVDVVSDDNQNTQTLVLDGREGRWEVLESTVRDAHGEIEWRLQNKEFVTLRAEDGTELRVPKKSRFEQPKEKADLIVKWKTRTINLEIDDEKFEIQLPSGIPRC